MPIEELLEILKGQPDPQKAWEQVLDLCAAKQSSRLWASLPPVDLDRDAAAARLWIDSTLAATQKPTCVYFGLDTLNMDDGTGTNVEIGWLEADTRQKDTHWAYGRLSYGEPFLIEGLVPLHEAYSRPEYDKDFSFADYILFLAYSGLVIREALKRTALTTPLLFAWGFHDGDLFCLCRVERSALEMLCS